MGEDAIDAASEFVPARVAPSITEKVPLLGADGYFALVNQTERVGAYYGLHPYRVRHLLDRYGSLIGEVLAMAEDKPDLLSPITDAPVYLKVEAVYAVAAEGALHLEDILARRMRISIEYPHRGVDCAREVAEIVAPVLGWDEADIQREVDTYAARVDAEVRSQQQPDDESADALRQAAPEARAQILEPVPAQLRPAPLPVRDGLGPARLRLRGGPWWTSCERRFGAAVAAKVSAGEVVDADGTVLDDASVMPAGSHVYFYRELADEVPVPFDIPVLYRDDDLVVVDKPHFLATMPRGRHVAQTALVRLRRDLALPELSPAHRLDRLTAGVLLFTARHEVRGRYQSLFAEGLVRKTYLARSSGRPIAELPRVVRNRIVKRRGNLQACVEARNTQRRDAGAAVGRGRVPAYSAHRPHPPTAGAHGLTGPTDWRRSVVPQRHRRSRRRLLNAHAASRAQYRVR